jgi:hypothetical protein
LLMESPAPLQPEEVAAWLDVLGVKTAATLEPLVSDLKHELTHRRLHVDAYRLRASQSPAGDWLRVPLSQLGDYAFPKVVNLLCERAFTPSSE